MKSGTVLAFFAASLALCLCAQGDESQGSFTGAKVEKNASSLWVKSPEGRLLAGVCPEGEDKASMKQPSVSVEPCDDFIESGVSRLKIDAGDFAKGVSDKIVVRLFSFPGPSAAEAAGKFCLVELWAKADVDGAPCALFLEGETSDGKHFYKAHDEILSSKWKKLGFAPDVVVPSNIKKLWLRFDIRSGVVSVAKPSLAFKPEASSVSSGSNLIVNGGAERGWHATATAFAPNKADPGAPLYNWEGKKYEPPFAEWSVDDSVARSGKRSFKAVAKGTGAFARLNFNPVPFEPGKPATFSVALKADRKCSGSIGLFIASGIAYAKRVELDGNWRVFTLRIPSWGAEAPDVNRIGDVAGGYGCVLRLAYPQVDVPSNATIWVDDAAYALGTEAKTSQERLWLRGSLDRGSAFYQPGELAKSSFELENPSSSESLELETCFELFDYFGSLVSSSRPQNLSLAPGETKRLESSFTPSLRGPMNYVLKAKDKASGETFVHSLYLGVCKKASKLHPWFGIDLCASQNSQVMAGILKDFGIGSVRLWSSYWKPLDRFRGFDQVKTYKDAGMFVLMNVSDNEPFVPVNGLVLLDQAPFGECIGSYAARFKGLVDCYEVANEPNIWPVPKGDYDRSKYAPMSVDGYVNMAKVVAGAVKAVDPAAKIAGPATCHTDVSWTSAILAKGAGESLDIITEHPYRSRPETPDYERDLIALKAAIAKYAPGKPFFASECGELMPSHPESDLVSPKVRDAVARSVRMQLIALANGVGKYIHFAGNLGSDGTNWNILYLGTPEFPGEERPNPYLYAIRNMQERVDGAKPLGRCDIGASFRCYAFEKDGKRVVALWKCQEEERPSSVEFRTPPQGVKAFDVMGNPLSFSGRSLELSPSPCYLETELGLDALKELFSQAAFTGVGAPFSTSLSVIDENEFAVNVENRVNRPLSAKVELSAEPGLLASENEVALDKIPPNGSGRALFKLAKPVDAASKIVQAKTVLADGSAFDVVSLNLRAMLCPKAVKPIKIDGDLSDWPSAKPVLLDLSNAVKDGPSPWRAEDDKTKASVRVAWRDDGLYIAVDVEKKDYFPEGGVGGISELWRGDGLQIAFDPLKDGKIAKKGEDCSNDDDFEYCIGVMKGEPVVYCRRASSVVYDGLGKSVGVVKGEVEVCAKASPGHVVYEMKLPPRSVSPFRLVEGESMRWDVIVNLNDGKDRLGWLELTRGIGQCKSPGDFMDLVLVK